MDFSESLKIVKAIEARYPAFKPTEDVELVWAEDFMVHFADYDAKWIWMKLKGAMEKEGSNFTPSLPWFIDQAYVGVREKKLGEKYNTLQVEAPKEYVPDDVVARNMAKVRELLKAAEAKAAQRKEDREISYRDMAEQRTFGRVLTDEERETKRLERAEMNIDPQKESKLLALYIEHVGHDGAAQPGQMMKRKKGKR